MAQSDLLRWVQQAKSKERASGKLDVGALPPMDPKLMFEALGAARVLHTELEDAFGEVDLLLTDNRRRMLSAKRRGGRLEVRAHHMFVTQGARGDWLVGFVRGEDWARAKVREFVSSNRETINHEVDQHRLETSGEHHDLMEHLEAARDLLIGAPIEDVAICWGRRSKGERSIRLGSYDFEQRLVRVHPALDQSWVPGYFVEFVVYHELVHAVVGVKVEGGRREVHTPEFRDLERLHPCYDDAMEWERRHIGRVLRARR